MATNLAKVLVKNGDGKYLILRSSEWPENPKRSLQPDLPGGIVEDGETPEIGAAREVQEEVGILVRPEDLKLAYSAPESHNGKDYHRYIYFLALPDIPSIELSWEHDKYWWKSAEEVLALEMRDPYPIVFKHMAEAKLLA